MYRDNERERNTRVQYQLSSSLYRKREEPDESKIHNPMHATGNLKAIASEADNER